MGNDRQKCGHVEKPKAIGSQEYARREGTCLAGDRRAVGQHAGLSVDLIEAGAAVVLMHVVVFKVVGWLDGLH